MKIFSRKNKKIVLDEEPINSISKFDVISETIFNLVGTSANFKNYRNCMTRLRFVIKDKLKVNENEIKKILIVKGINWSIDELQLVL